MHISTLPFQPFAVHLIVFTELLNCFPPMFPFTSWLVKAKDAHIIFSLTSQGQAKTVFFNQGDDDKAVFLFFLTRMSLQLHTLCEWRALESFLTFKIHCYLTSRRYECPMCACVWGGDHIDHIDQVIGKEWGIHTVVCLLCCIILQHHASDSHLHSKTAFTLTNSSSYSQPPVYWSLTLICSCLINK